MESLSILVMNLMEDFTAAQAFNKPQVIIQGSGKNLQPPPIPQKREFKPRDYSSLRGDPVHLIELKQALLRRLEDPELIKQFKEEIEKLKKQLFEMKVSEK